MAKSKIENFVGKLTESELYKVVEFAKSKLNKGTYDDIEEMRSVEEFEDLAQTCYELVKGEELFVEAKTRILCFVKWDEDWDINVDYGNMEHDYLSQINKDTKVKTTISEMKIKLRKFRKDANQVAKKYKFDTDSFIDEILDTAHSR